MASVRVVFLCLIIMTHSIVNAVAVQAGHSSTPPSPDPRLVSLTLADLPAGTVLVKEQYLADADLARIEGVPLKSVRKTGVLSTYNVMFRIGDGGGLHLSLMQVGVTMAASVYDTANHAQSAWSVSVKRQNQISQYRATRISRVGSAHSAWSYTQIVGLPGSAPLRVTEYIITFYRGRYIAHLSASSKDGAFRVSSLSRLAKVVDGRILHSLD